MTTIHLDEICYRSRSDFISSRCDSPVMHDSLFCEKHSFKNGELGGNFGNQKRRKMRPDHRMRKRDWEWNNTRQRQWSWWKWGECGKCGRDGHTSEKCSYYGPITGGGGWRTGSGPDRCRNCGEDGHISRDCEE